MKASIRVLIVEDSAFMRQFIANIISSDPALEVVATARNGAEGVEKAKEYKPDVITMDVEMPVMDGLTAVKEIMAVCPTPILMLSSVTTDGADATLRALEYGAIDFVTKPSGAISLDLNKKKDLIIQKVKMAAGARVMAVSQEIRRLAPIAKSTVPMIAKKLHKVIAIGTSTGGPKALQDIIPLLPRSIPAGILIVQHMPKGFTKSLADRLDSLSQITVREAQDGDELLPGLALLAPGDYHMEAQEIGGRVVVRLNQNPPLGGHRPSVDIMFNSVAKLSQQLVGVILTGMGGDGSDGMVNIKGRNGRTIAQNEASCVVFGMPKVAIDKKAVDRVVPLNQIAMEIMKIL
ncbi:MAG TPA: chemotaxis response regulator protein-glutamate methylesterase [Bacillota bacterium]|nr:chemotaxis response regulator protein-glutamate methylesterase [Bacillota bacterium]